MALKPVMCSGETLSLQDRVLKLAKKLKPGECYVTMDVAQEFGVSREGVVQAARRAGVYAMRSGVRGTQLRGVIVNPAHVGGVK